MLKQPLWPYLIAQSSPNSGAILRLDDDQPSIDETAPAKIIRQLPSPIDLPLKMSNRILFTISQFLRAAGVEEQRSDHYSLGRHHSVVRHIPWANLDGQGHVVLVTGIAREIGVDGWCEAGCHHISAAEEKAAGQSRDGFCKAHHRDPDRSHRTHHRGDSHRDDNHLRGLNILEGHGD